MAQILNLVLIFLCYLGDIDPSGWIIFSTATLVFFGGLGLKLISERGIMGLSFIFVLVGSLIAMLPISVILVFLDRQLIFFQVPGIDLLSPGGWLQVGFCFYINSFLYHLVPRIQVSSSIVQLDSK